MASYLLLCAAGLKGHSTALLLLLLLMLSGAGCANKLLPAAARTFIVAPESPAAVVATRLQVAERSPSAAGEAGSSCI